MKADLVALQERVRAATGPDRELDYEIMLVLTIPDFRSRKYPAWAVKSGLKPYTMWGCLRYDAGGNPDKVAHLTGSIDAAVALVERVLPGWAWRAGTCCVSDDAWLVPDFNCPIHGDRLKADLFPIKSGDLFDAGIDIDRRPPGNIALALIEALIQAKIAQADASDGLGGPRNA